ncbi:hypothetical protein [Cupriavidus lacunae]|uniref:hypothetical protein n=1 Tax=Cupriavidus lacunae TaxID=2666307 RepID=UPI001FC9FEC2|nr:hypothetical protein [Cupriavidus lacunae]
MQIKPDATTFFAFTVVLLDGREVLVREIAESDKAGLVAAFSRLSADARYARFMAAMQQLPETMLAQAIHPAAEREFALVALAWTDRNPFIMGWRELRCGGGQRYL